MSGGGDGASRRNTRASLNAAVGVGRSTLNAREPRHRYLPNQQVPVANSTAPPPPQPFHRRPVTIAVLAEHRPAASGLDRSRPSPPPRPGATGGGGGGGGDEQDDVAAVVDVETRNNHHHIRDDGGSSELTTRSATLQQQQQSPPPQPQEQQHIV